MSAITLVMAGSSHECNRSSDDSRGPKSSFLGGGLDARHGSEHSLVEIRLALG
jgi:hypothetical protein